MDLDILDFDNGAVEAFVINLDYHPLDKALAFSKLQLQHLTDGWNIKRVFRKEHIEAEENCLIIYFK